MGRDYHRKFLENIIINVMSVAGKKSPIISDNNDDSNMNVTYALLEDGVRIGKELLQFSDSWTSYAGDTIKMLDLLMPIRSM
jgi:hypothetical protein